MNILKNAILFTVGGGAYTALELLFRKRSHESMFFLGGGCFLALGRIWQRKTHPARKLAAGAAAVTAGELITGLALNRDHRIWDYRKLPLNFRGQICLPFSLLWMLLTPAAGMLYRWCEKRL